MTQEGTVKLDIPSPARGTVIPLSDVKDEVFAQMIVGKGAAVIPSENRICAPAEGTVQSIFSTGHAICLKLDCGVELLIHIGLGTVELGGRYFTARVQEGARVAKGQTLIEFDREAICKAGYDVVTPVVVSNTEDYLDVLAAENGEVEEGGPLLTVLL